MADRSASDDDRFLKDAVLYKIEFPRFWERAYREKNDFFHLIQRDAENYAQTMGKGAECPDGEKVRHFWHEHCWFCWEKATTDTDRVFYCTEDMGCWICEGCFNDFRDEFGWTVKEGEVWSPKERYINRRKGIIRKKN